ncbi:hypothetical protein CEXT_271531 [Caerostris extrusa]|uniref:Uncharacterized protein n=1 Tax=Caerostris extrusa TaxID=172846 RepID=A0AAV4RUH3_CAEEX|nr:hypothetical protein CEXT_271531 [Caerostris extrusa]
MHLIGLWNRDDVKFKCSNRLRRSRRALSIFISRKVEFRCIRQLVAWYSALLWRYAAWRRLQQSLSQHLPPLQGGHNKDSIPLHLPVLSPHQSGYIIVPNRVLCCLKTTDLHCQERLNRKPDRKPPNAPPGKNRPPNNRQRRPQQPNKKINQPFNNVPYQQAGSQQHKNVLPNGQFPPRNNFNQHQFLDATIPQNVKPDQSGQNRPPILPNFQHPPLGVNVNPNDFFNNLPPRKLKIESTKECAYSLDLSQILNSPYRENEVLDHALPQATEIHSAPPINDNPSIGNLGEVKIPPFTEKSSNQGHFPEPQSHAEALKQNEQEKNFNIPFPDFVEPEPGPQLQPSNFPANLNVNNRIITPQESKQNQVAVKAKMSKHLIKSMKKVLLFLCMDKVPPMMQRTVLKLTTSWALHDGSEDERWPIVMPENA